MYQDLTRGNVTKSMLLFACPMILGDLLQQFYNIADTLIVGHFIGSDALAAVGSSFTLMTFLTSILLGLCMGSGVVFSMLFGAGKESELKNSIFISFFLTGILAVLIEALVLVFLDPLLLVLRIPDRIFVSTRCYLQIVFCGILFTFLYNFFMLTEPVTIIKLGLSTSGEYIVDTNHILLNNYLI